jgi:hypothetical protein
MLSGLGFPSPKQRENRVVQQLSFWTVAIFLRAVAQKLQKLCSFPRGSEDPEGFPQLLRAKLSLSSMIANMFCIASI